MVLLGFKGTWPFRMAGISTMAASGVSMNWVTAEPVSQDDGSDSKWSSDTPSYSGFRLAITPAPIFSPPPQTIMGVVLSTAAIIKSKNSSWSSGGDEFWFGVTGDGGNEIVLFRILGE